MICKERWQGDKSVKIFWLPLNSGSIDKNEKIVGTLRHLSQGDSPIRSQPESVSVVEDVSSITETLIVGSLKFELVLFLAKCDNIILKFL